METSVSTPSVAMLPTRNKIEEAIKLARMDISNMLNYQGPSNFAAHLLKLAFYDVLFCGGNGSIRLQDGLDEDIANAIKRLGELKASQISNGLYQYISYADLYQLGAIEALRKIKGPLIEFVHGRVDSYSYHQGEELRIIKGDEGASYIRSTFNNLGFSDREIVALSWAFNYWENYPTPRPRTTIRFNNSYFMKLQNMKGLESVQSSGEDIPNLSFYHWSCLKTDMTLHGYVDLYTKNPQLFFDDYAIAHKKLSTIGLKNFKDNQYAFRRYNVLGGLMEKAILNGQKILLIGTILLMVILAIVYNYLRKYFVAT